MVVGNTSQHLPQLAIFENQTSGSFTWWQMHVVQLDNTSGEACFQQSLVVEVGERAPMLQ